MFQMAAALHTNRHSDLILFSTYGSLPIIIPSNKTDYCDDTCHTLRYRALTSSSGGRPRLTRNGPSFFPPLNRRLPAVISNFTRSYLPASVGTDDKEAFYINTAILCPRGDDRAPRKPHLFRVFFFLFFIPLSKHGGFEYIILFSVAIIIFYRPAPGTASRLFALGRAPAEDVFRETLSLLAIFLRFSFFFFTPLSLLLYTYNVKTPISNKGTDIIQTKMNDNRSDNIRIPFVRVNKHFDYISRIIIFAQSGYIKEKR